MKLADKTILNILANSSRAFFLMLSSIVMVRHFSKQDYGTFLQLMLIVNTTMLLGLLGFPQSIYYFYHRTMEQAGFIFQILMLSLVIGLTGGLIIFFMMDTFALWLNNSALTNYANIAGVMILFRIASQFREPLLISEGSLILNSLLTLFCGLLFYLPTILGPFFVDNIDTLIKLMVIGCAIEFFIYIFTCFQLIRRNKDKKLRQSETETSCTSIITLKEILRYSLPIGLSSYIGIIGRQIDKYIVSVFFKPMDFAVYSRGALQIPVLGNFQFTVNNVLMPQYVRNYRSGDIDSLIAIFHRSIRKVAKLKYPAFSLLFAISPSLITLLYTASYIEAVPVLRAYLLLLLTSVAVYGIIPRATGKTLYISYATGIAIISNIVISLILLPKFGPLGAALGTVFASLINISYLLFQSSRILNISLKNIFPWKYLYKLLVISIIASLPLYVMQFIIHANGVKLALFMFFQVVVYAYVWFFLMMKYNLISNDDIEILSRWLRIDLKTWLPRITFCQTFNLK